ncbi:fatty acyl-AMP ligase [Nocardia sp. 2]|uniref:Fatty acyl-AMP ligase n=1 Tax=Nocardia acididurans TaxID=2802282 RepID=A0ABS1M870_9NOCA|nr:fatty acyl-AMP ligase [Nocardia acididurans]MBL1076414.1 fatty acyl-AMP ligase [Nocardia acididurans]
MDLECSAQYPPTLVEALSRRVTQTPRERAYRFSHYRQDDEDVDYGQLWERVGGLAAQVRAATAPGDRVVLLCPPGPDFVYAFFACMVSGRVAVAAHLPMSAQQVETLRAIIADSGAVAAIAPLAIVPLDQASLGPDIRIIDSGSAAALSGADPLAGPPPGPDDIAFLQYTSGSTGMPKGVTVLHRNLIDNLGRIASKYAMGQRTSIVSWLPPFHDMGLIQGVLLPAFLGGRATLLSPMTFLRDPLIWLRAISGTPHVVAGGPNLAYGLCLKRVSPAAAAGLDLSGWELAFVGAEPVDPVILRRFAEMFAENGFRASSLTPMYGLAESTLFVNGGPAGAGARSRHFRTAELEQGVAVVDTEGRELVSMGPVRDCELAIVDPRTRQRCAGNRVGEIWLRGPSVTAGYWRQPAANERAFEATITDGDGAHYLRTGDLGFVAEGELYISGRIKELMIVHGRNIFPQDVERTILSNHPTFRPGGCAVFAAQIDNEDRVMVVQELNEPPAQDTAAALEGSIRDVVSRAHAISVHRIIFVGKGEVPKTTSGKIQRQRLRAEYSSPALLQESAK